MKICTQCQTQQPDDRNFCSNCGGMLASLQATITIPPKHRSIGKRIVVFLLLAAIVVGSLYYLGIFKSDEQKIRERIVSFEDAFNDGDLNGMLSCFDKKTRNAYRAAMNIFGSGLSSIIGFGVSFDDMFSIGATITEEIHFEIQEITINGKTAVVKATLKSEDGEFTLVKEGLNWYICDDLGLG